MEDNYPPIQGIVYDDTELNMVEGLFLQTLGEIDCIVRKITMVEKCHIRIACENGIIMELLCNCNYSGHDKAHVLCTL